MYDWTVAAVYDRRTSKNTEGIPAAGAASVDRDIDGGRALRAQRRTDRKGGKTGKLKSPKPHSTFYFRP
jgi:hypothetical protein